MLGAIIHSGKDIENRVWTTTYRGPLLIHAAKPLTKPAYADFLLACKEEGRRVVDIPAHHELLRQTGGIVGIVDLVDVVEKSRSKWFCGPYAFVLKNPKPLPFRPMPGKLGLFDVSPRP